MVLRSWAFGTSLPELIVSINANLTGSVGIAIGNVVGSNIANILFVLGVTAVMATLTVTPRDILRDTVMMLLSCVLMMGLMIHGNISRLAGIGMIGVLILYVLWQYIMARKGKIEVDDLEEPAFPSLLPAVLALIGGLVCIALGAEFLIRGAKITATIVGVPEDVIGLSVIALGTSLPELSTCVIAAVKRQTGIVVGNILGSNVFNVLMIIGATAGVKAIESSAIAPQVVTFDIWVMFGTTAVLSLILLLYKKLNRFLGILFILAYLLYIGTLYTLYLGEDILPL